MERKGAAKGLKKEGKINVIIGDKAVKPVVHLLLTTSDTMLYTPGCKWANSAVRIVNMFQQ